MPWQSLVAMRCRGWTDHRIGHQTSHQVRNLDASRTLLEGAIGEGENPVGESIQAWRGIREYGGTRGIPLEAGGTTLQG
jgi:hypothetical protein